MRWLLPIEFLVFGVITVVVIVGTPTMGKSPLRFTILWVGALIRNGYWFLRHIGHSIEVDGTRVIWRVVL